MNTIERGSSGSEVSELQAALVKAGYNIAVDGSFGLQTKTALESFQEKNGLSPDGICGPATWAKINGNPAPSPTPAPSGNTLKGIDVSHYQPNFNFAQAKADGCVFMMAKATEGSSIVDSKLVQQVTNAKAQGFIRGAYHFFHASQNVTAQVDLYLKEVLPLKLEMPCILDLEESSADGQTHATIRAAALEWLKQVAEQTGRAPILYGDTSFLQSLALGSDFAIYPLWLAAYNSHPKVPAPWTAWTFWQYTDKGEEKADTDKFAGSLADLQAFCKV